jgi:hypothetical protein
LVKYECLDVNVLVFGNFSSNYWLAIFHLKFNARVFGPPVFAGDYLRKTDRKGLGAHSLAEAMPRL